MQDKASFTEVEGTDGTVTRTKTYSRLTSFTLITLQSNSITNGFLSAQLFAELGYEHTGGEKMSPSSSFAGGFGGGMTWRLTNRWAVRVSGDRIGAAFSPQNNTPTLALSPHVSWNARATVGAVYRF